MLEKSDVDIDVETRQALLDMGIVDFYVEQEYNALLRANVLKIYIAEHEVQKLIQGVQNGKRKQRIKTVD